MQSPKTIPASYRPTPRQLRLLRSIADCQARRCYSPTIAELASESGINRSTTFEHIEQLRKKGLLSASPGRARSLSLTSRAHALLESIEEPEADSESAGEIPLAGIVAAGVPVEAVENTESVSLDSCFGRENFALEVRGDSMIDADIREGDYIICRRTARVKDGDLVVAIVGDDGATVKRFYREQSRIRLEPANDAYEPIYCQDCRIEAVVVGLLRRL